MKRIKAACICQTLHFMLKEDIAHDLAVRQVQEEVTHYKHTLERNHTLYKIIEETTQPDGSVIIQIIKQYNQSPVGYYLNVNTQAAEPLLRRLFLFAANRFPLTGYTACWYRSRWSAPRRPIPR